MQLGSDPDADPTPDALECLFQTLTMKVEMRRIGSEDP